GHLWDIWDLRRAWVCFANGTKKWLSNGANSSCQPGINPSNPPSLEEAPVVAYHVAVAGSASHSPPSGFVNG
ncbi:MAG: hypothetical protein WC378_16570, partial [Opitutaceae bacterium]